MCLQTRSHRTLTQLLVSLRCLPVRLKTNRHSSTWEVEFISMTIKLRRCLLRIHQLTMTIPTRSLLSQVIRTTRLHSFNHNQSCSQLQSQLLHLDQVLHAQVQMPETQEDHPIRLDLAHQLDLFHQRSNLFLKTSPACKCNQLNLKSTQTHICSGTLSLKMSTSKMTSERESIASQEILKPIAHLTLRTTKINRRRSNP